MSNIPDIEKLNNPSAIEVISITLKKFDNKKILDIRPLVVSIHLSAGITNASLYGYMVLADSNSLLANEGFTILGEEFLEIHLKQPKAIKVPETEFKYKFIVDQVDSDQLADQSSGSVFKVTLRSVDSFINAGAIRSKSYSNTIPNIVKSILNNELKTEIPVKDENFEEIKDVTTYAFIESKPFEKIALLTQQAYNDIGTLTSTFLFYETFKSGYKFESFENIIQRGIQTYSANNESKRSYSYNTTTSATRHGFDSILTYNKPYRFSMSEKLAYGYFNTRVIAYDMIQKRPRIDEVILPKKMKEQSSKKLNPNADTRNTDMFIDKFKDLGNVNYLIPFAEESVPARNDSTRKSLLYSSPFSLVLKENTIACKLYGAMYLDIGDIVNLNFPDNKSINDNSKSNDKDISGDFIITDINHEINLTGQGYEFFTSIVCAKESTTKNIAFNEATDIQIKAIQGNIPEATSPYAPENQAPSKPPLSNPQQVLQNAIQSAANSVQQANTVISRTGSAISLAALLGVGGG